jgi:hypothetical protein
VILHFIDIHKTKIFLYLENSAFGLSHSHHTLSPPKNPRSFSRLRIASIKDL